MLAVSAAAGLMQLHHHGTTDGVTGSCHELVLEDARRAADPPALVADPRHAIELIRRDVTFPLYVEVDEIDNLACPASPIHDQFDPVQTTKTSVHGAINTLGALGIRPNG